MRRAPRIWAAATHVSLFTEAHTAGPEGLVLPHRTTTLQFSGLASPGSSPTSAGLCRWAGD